jgi:F-type H+-transporting ATPase subunit b
MRVSDFIFDRVRRPRAHAVCVALLVALLVAAQPRQAHAQDHGSTAASAQPATDHAAPASSDPLADQPAAPGHVAAPDAHGTPDAAHEAEGEHGESLWSFLSRIANFLLLAFGIWYFARSPLGKYLVAKSEQIRHDLAHAEATRHDAEAQLASIEQQMKALPGELDALRARGVEEIAAEEARIRELAATERERLLEQTRREIDTQLRAARRELTRHAADLAVNVATARIKSRITDEDQARLVDRYVAQVKTTHD